MFSLYNGKGVIFVGYVWMVCFSEMKQSMWIYMYIVYYNMKQCLRIWIDFSKGMFVGMVFILCIIDEFFELMVILLGIFCKVI